MASQQQPQPAAAAAGSRRVDWDDLCNSQDVELKVPVSLFILCKTVVEDDQGALFLNGTLVQRILVDNVPVNGTSPRYTMLPPSPTRTATPSVSGPAEARDNLSAEDHQMRLEALLFPIKIKGPMPSDPPKGRRIDLVDLPAEATTGAQHQVGDGALRGKQHAGGGASGPQQAGGGTSGPEIGSVTSGAQLFASGSPVARTEAQPKFCGASSVAPSSGSSQAGGAAQRGSGATSGGTQIEKKTKLCTQTLDLVFAPLDIHQHWHRFPFRILKATVDLELQVRYRHSGFGEAKVLLCPDLLSPNIKSTFSTKDLREKMDHIVRVKVPDRLSRLRRLAFINEWPTVEMCCDERLRKGVAQYTRPEDVLFRYPQLRLTFWLYEPISKAIFKIVGPLFLVVSLMLMNFQEYFGFYAMFRNECGKASGSDSYQDYFANGVGIALAAFFVTPSIRAETTKSPGVSFTWDDCIAVIFLLGLAISNAPQCHVAFSGCLLCVLVVLYALISLICHNKEKNALQHSSSTEPLTVQPSKGSLQENATKPRAVEFDDTQWVRNERKQAPSAGRGT